MPVFEQGYRKYVGERSSGSRVPLIAWENIRPRMKWWGWVLLFLLNFWPYVIYAVLIFMTTLGTSMFGARPVMPQSPPTVVFGNGNGPNPGAVLGLLRGDMLGLVWELLQHASFAAVIFPSVVAAGLLASDRRTGGLQIYFSRPITKLDYMLGKILAATCFVALTTVVPCLLLWIESVAFGSASTFTWRTWVAPLAIVGASAFYALWTVALVLSLSAVMRRPAFVTIVAAFVNLALEMLGEILAEAYRDKAWHVLQPSYALGTLTAPLCGLDVPDWISPVAAIGIGFALPAALLALVWWRLRAVEVAT
jgi:hypothetical protein